MDLSGSEFPPELVFVRTSCCLRKSHFTLYYVVPCLQFLLQNLGQSLGILQGNWKLTPFQFRMSHRFI